MPSVSLWTGALPRRWNQNRWIASSSSDVFLLAQQQLERRDLRSGELVWSVGCLDQILLGAVDGILVTCRFLNRRIEAGYYQFSARSTLDGSLLWTCSEEMRKPLWHVPELERLAVKLSKGTLLLLDQPRFLTTGEPAVRWAPYGEWAEWLARFSHGRVAWRMGCDALVQDGTGVKFIQWPDASPSIRAEGIAGSWVYGRNKFGLYGLDPTRGLFRLDGEGRVHVLRARENWDVTRDIGRIGGLLNSATDLPVRGVASDYIVVGEWTAFTDHLGLAVCDMYGRNEGHIAFYRNGESVLLVGGSAAGVLVLCTQSGVDGSLQHITRMEE